MAAARPRRPGGGSRSGPDPGPRAPLPRRRDRHGRGLRGPLLRQEVVPPGGRRPVRVPRALTRREAFDDLVLTVLETLEARLGPDDARRLASLEVGVDEVPPVDEEEPLPAVDVLEEDGVPLALLVEGSSPRRGPAVPPRVVLYRRPLEARASGEGERVDVVLDVLVEAVSRLLHLDPDELHPDGPAED